MRRKTHVDPPASTNSQGLTTKLHDRGSLEEPVGSGIGAVCVELHSDRILHV